MAVDVNAILRPNAEALIPEDVLPGIIQGAIQGSTVLTHFRRLPNMASNIKSMAVLESLPMTYWVNGDTGQKKTTKAEWDSKYIHAAELAAIVPIPEAVLEDARSQGTDLFSEIQPLLVQALGQAIDEAIIFGINKPVDWRPSIVDSAIASGHVIARTSDMYQDIFGENGAIAKIEMSGFMPNGVLSSVGMAGALRGLVDNNNRPLFILGSTIQQGPPSYSLNGMPTTFVRNGAWQDDKASMIIGDMTQAVYSIRKDVTYKMLTESIIQNPDGTIAYNLAQQDMVALRVVMRLGWEIPNPINALAPDRATRSPFAVYAPNA